ncbi:hypothetical protein T484DRAFT_1825459 [Baffinella frigidus]|nr:hypothetical protein T484DRAFT_1825459 [Cryptophyta sp. CCMP2293]
MKDGSQTARARMQIDEVDEPAQRSTLGGFRFKMAKWFQKRLRLSSDSAEAVDVEDDEDEHHRLATCLKHRAIKCTECEEILMPVASERETLHILRKRYFERSGASRVQDGAASFSSSRIRPRQQPTALGRVRSVESALPELTERSPFPPILRRDNLPTRDPTAREAARWGVLPRSRRASSVNSSSVRSETASRAARRVAEWELLPLDPSDRIYAQRVGASGESGGGQRGGTYYA